MSLKDDLGVLRGGLKANVALGPCARRFVEAALDDLPRLRRRIATLEARLARVLGEAHAWRAASWEQADVVLTKGHVWSRRHAAPGGET